LSVALNSRISQEVDMIAHQLLVSAITGANSGSRSINAVSSLTP
jgi:hypothetical protein